MYIHECILKTNEPLWQLMMRPDELFFFSYLFYLHFCFSPLCRFHFLSLLYFRPINLSIEFSSHTELLTSHGCYNANYIQYINSCNNIFYSQKVIINRIPNIESAYLGGSCVCVCVHVHNVRIYSISDQLVKLYWRNGSIAISNWLNLFILKHMEESSTIKKTIKNKWISHLK